MNILPLEIILQIAQDEELKVWDILQFASCSRKLWRMLEPELYRHSLEVVYPLHPPPSYASYDELDFVRKARQREIAQSSFAAYIKTLEFVLCNRPNSQHSLEATNGDGAAVRGILSGCTHLQKLTLRAGKVYRTGQHFKKPCSPIDLFTTLAFAIRVNRDLKELSISGEYRHLPFPPPEGAFEALLELEGDVVADIQKLDIDYEIAAGAQRAPIMDTTFEVLGQSIRGTKELIIDFSLYNIRIRSIDTAEYAKHFPIESASWPFQNLRKLICGNDSNPQQILCIAVTKIDTTKIIELGVPLRWTRLGWVAHKFLEGLRQFSKAEILHVTTYRQPVERDFREAKALAEALPSSKVINIITLLRTAPVEGNVRKGYARNPPFAQMDLKYLVHWDGREIDIREA